MNFQRPTHLLTAGKTETWDWGDGFAQAHTVRSDRAGLRSADPEPRGLRLYLTNLTQSAPSRIQALPASRCHSGMTCAAHRLGALFRKSPCFAYIFEFNPGPRHPSSSLQFLSLIMTADLLSAGPL